MTTFEYAFQDPAVPLIVDPFEYVGDDDHALAVRVIPPALAATAAQDLLRIRTTILQEAGAPKDVLTHYDPATEAANQVRKITQAGHNTHYLSASVGPSIHVQKLAERDERGMPLYTGLTSPEMEIDPDLPADVKAYLQEQLEERRAKERTVEQYLKTIGLAKLTCDEEGLRIEALDVDPEYRRMSVASLLLYKGFGIYGNHAGVQPRQAASEVDYYDTSEAEECDPLIVQAKVPKFDEQLPTLLESIDMDHDGYEYVGNLRTVQAALAGKLRQRGLIEAAEA